MSSFLATQLTSENYWRAIVLLGRNVASYKLALAKSLLTFAAEGRTFVRLEDLAVPYTQHLTEHLKAADKQCTAASSRFLNICREFNGGKASKTALVDGAVSLGFANVIDAFHVVNRREVGTRFFVDDRKAKKGITLTDSLLSLARTTQARNFPLEAEARWRLLESAWSLGLPPSMVSVNFEPEGNLLFVQLRSGRIPVTGCREALNGYQKGRCFYCFRDIDISSGSSAVDVDHFIPFAVRAHRDLHYFNLNGVWNLVLACPACNRGVGGKFMLVPCLDYLARLHRRNQFFIESHHPLRETLMNQTGLSEPVRRAFLQRVHGVAVRVAIHVWRSPHEGPPAF